MATPDTNRQHLIAWDGISLLVPEDWEVGAISQQEHGGYLRIDSSERPRVEVNWAESKGFVDMDEVIDKYLLDTQRQRRKQFREETEVKPGDRAISRGKLGKPGVKTFSWEGSQKALGAGWLCKKCNRHVFMQIIGEKDEPGLAALAESIISSARDHSEEEDWVRWAVYGLDTWIPQGFRPTKQQLMAGRVELSFGRDTENITVTRWGLANVVLKDRTLDDWARAQLWKELKNYGPRSEPEPFHGDEGLRVIGDRVFFLQAAQRFFSHIAGKLFADRIITCLWHCEPENKIYVVETKIDLANRGMVDEVVARTRCH